MVPSCNSPETATAHAVAGLQTFRNFKSLATLVFGLARGPDLALRNLIAMQQENFVNAVAIVHRAFRQENCFFFFLAGNRRLHKESRLQTAIAVVQQGLCVKRARILGHRWIDARDLRREKSRSEKPRT